MISSMVVAHRLVDCVVFDLQEDSSQSYVQSLQMVRGYDGALPYVVHNPSPKSKVEGLKYVMKSQEIRCHAS